MRERFADLDPRLQAAVEAYDLARRTLYGRQGEPSMSDENKHTIAPMIMCAIRAYEESK